MYKVLMKGLIVLAIVVPIWSMALFQLAMTAIAVMLMLGPLWIIFTTPNTVKLQFSKNNSKENDKRNLVVKANDHIKTFTIVLNDKTLEAIIKDEVRGNIKNLISRLEDHSTLDDKLLSIAESYGAWLAKYIYDYKDSKEGEAKRQQEEYLRKEAAAKAKRDEDSRKAEELRRKKEKEERSRQQYSKQNDENTNNNRDSKQKKNNWNGTASQSNSYCPYQALGKNKESTNEEIKRAYVVLMKQYHPDQVAHLGQELKDLALEKTKQINLAFNQIKSERGL